MIDYLAIGILYMNYDTSWLHRQWLCGLHERNFRAFLLMWNSIGIVFLHQSWLTVCKLSLEVVVESDYIESETQSHVYACLTHYKG
jgi:hypothetical protein